MEEAQTKIDNYYDDEDEEMSDDRSNCLSVGYLQPFDYIPLPNISEIFNRMNDGNK